MTHWKFRLIALLPLILPLPNRTATAAAAPLPSAVDRSPVVRRFGLTDGAAAPGTLKELVVQGIAANRGLRAAAAGVEAADAKVPQARALPDPTIGLITYLDPVETRVGPQQLGIQASQSFPWFGTLGAKGGVAGEKALAAREELDGKILAVMTDIRTRVLEIAYLDSSIAVTRRHLTLLKQWEKSAQDGYAAGGGSYRALVKAQVEIGKLDNRLASLRNRRTPLVAHLNAVLDRDPGAPVAGIVLPATPARDLDVQRLAPLVATNSPQLLAWNHMAAAADLQGKVAGKMGLPGFTVGVKMIRTGEARMPGVADSGKDALMASVGLRIPLWRGKVDAARDEARQDRLRAEDARAQALNDLNALLAMVVYRLQDAQRQVDLYAGALVPEAEQSLSAALDAFAADKAGFLDVIDAERMLLEFHLALARARTDELIQAAELEALIAAPLDSVS